MPLPPMNENCTRLVQIVANVKALIEIFSQRIGPSAQVPQFGPTLYNSRVGVARGDPERAHARPARRPRRARQEGRRLRLELRGGEHM